MTQRHSVPRLAGALLVVLAAALAACSTSASSSPAVPRVQASAAPTASAAVAPSVTASIDLTVYGAASLKGALDKVKAAYETAVPGTTLTISTDSSAALETQIEQGAPADVFLSADTTNPKKLVDKGLTSGPAVAFAGNTLTVIVPTANRAGITTPADLAKTGVKVIAAGDAVPISKYAGQLVANLAKLPTYPTGFAAAYAANIVSKEDNVAAVVAKIETGDGDAAIVYVTDAKKSNKVTTVPVPDDANVPATYAGVVVGSSAHQDAARAFMTWLTGPDGQAIAGLTRIPPATGLMTGPPRVTATRRSRPDRRLVAMTLPLILFLDRPGRGARRAFAARRAACWQALTSPVVLTALRLSLIDDGSQPRPDDRPRDAARLSPGSPRLPRLEPGRDRRRPADRPAAVGRRAGPAVRLRTPGTPRWSARGRGHQHPVHDPGRHPRPAVRRSAVLRPVGSDRHRRRSTRTPRTRRGSMGRPNATSFGG